MEALYIDRDSLIVPVEGELDEHMAECLRTQIDSVLARQGIRDIIYDFEQTKFMDSSGIGMIMGRHRQVSYIGGRTGVCNVGRSMDRLLRMSGLYRIVQRFESREEAAESFAETRESLL